MLMLASPIAEADTLDDVDFDPVLPCEDGRHPRGGAGCVPEQSASWFMLAPCCGARAVICDGRHNYLTGPIPAQIHCTRCDLYHPPGSYRFIPITES